MLWENIIGQDEVKNKLIRSIKDNRISHAQLFVSTEGSGALALAIAYAKEVLCEKDNLQCNLKVDKLQHPDLHFVFPYSATPSIKTLQLLNKFLARGFFIDGVAE